jgi:hypothetical protein
VPWEGGRAHLAGVVGGSRPWLGPAAPTPRPGARVRAHLPATTLSLEEREIKKRLSLSPQRTTKPPRTRAHARFHTRPPPRPLPLPLTSLLPLLPPHTPTPPQPAADYIILAVDVGPLGHPYTRLVGDVIAKLPATASVGDARLAVGTLVAKEVHKLTGRHAPLAVAPRLFLRMAGNDDASEVRPVELDAGALAADHGLEPSDFEYLVIAHPGVPPPGRGAAPAGAAGAGAASGRGAPRGRGAAVDDAPAPGEAGRAKYARGEVRPGAAISAYQARVAAAEEAAAAGTRAPLPAQKKRKRWTDAEDEALLTAAEKYGIGQWKLIWERSGGAGGPLASRSQVDLKDRYRNIQRKIEREAAGVEAEMA